MERSLDYGLRKLMLFRVVMVTTLLLIAAYVEAVSETLRVVNPLYYLIGATYLLTLIEILALRTLRRLEPQAYAQVIADLLIITGLVYVSGGIRTGFMLLYPISVLSGSVLVLRRGSLVLSGVATSLYAATLWLVRIGFLPPSEGLADVPFLPTKAILYSIFVTGVACSTAAMIGSFLSESLRRAGEELEEAAGEVASLREINEVIVNSIQSGLLTTDSAGRILYVNAFGETILKQAASAIRGRNIGEVFGSALEPLALKTRAGSRSLARLEIEYGAAGAPPAVLGVSVTRLATPDSTASGYLVVFQDLTEIKRLEDEIQIREKLAAVGEMAAQLAHEIRNPLGSISGSAQVLMGGANVSEDHERLLGIITRESKRLSDTLNRFLFQARPSGRQRGPVDLGPVLAEAVVLLRNGPEVGQVHGVTFEIDQGPHLCMADRDQILQVFWNLARNGLEAMPSGGQLRIRLQRQAKEVVLGVHDEGRGMARDEQRRMFMPFSGMGTGLGLAIVYRIVREHSGDIMVRSTPGQGTEVEVHLPLVPVAVEA